MGSFQHDKDRHLGDSNLKRFKRGTLATNTPLTPLDYKIYMLFAKGITAKRIQSALLVDHVTYNEQQLFDVIRKVGFEAQAFYRKLISIPFNKTQIIFADFIKGESLQQLSENYALDPRSLVGILRQVALLYWTYRHHYMTKKS